VEVTDEAERRYQALKAALLEAGAAGAMTIDAMEAALARASALRRALDQAAKAARLSAAPVPAPS
jgi:phosphate:Na+ symporter